MNPPLEFWIIENLELFPKDSIYQDLSTLVFINIFRENKNLHGVWADEKTVNISPFSIHHKFTASSESSMQVLSSFALHFDLTWSIWREMLSLVQNNSSNHVMIWSDRILRDTFVFCVYYIKYESPN